MSQDHLVALSSERFERYMKWSNNDSQKALELYALNTKLSEAFYPSLQILEITLRNRINDVLTKEYGAYWFDEPDLLNDMQQKQLDKIKDQHKRRYKKFPKAGKIVSETSLWFWVTMLKKNELWKEVLHEIVRPEYRGGLKRRDFYSSLDTFRVLRNRIAHHEPIIHLKDPNLHEHHDKILDALSRLSPWAEQWCKENSCLPEICPEGRIVPVPLTL